MVTIPPVTPERAMMNLHKGLESLGVNTNIDYYKLGLKLAEPHRRLIRRCVYTGAYDQTREPDKHAAQAGFFNRGIVNRQISPMRMVTVLFDRRVILETEG